MIIERKLTKHIKRMLKQFPIVSITGPRQAGKTTLLKTFFPEYKYYNLERVDYKELIQNDVIGFLTNTGPYVIFDEAQNLPELFSYIQVISDDRNIPGQYILSGSQSFLLNENISQSLAGRVNVNHLYPFDITELSGKNIKNHFEIILKGFYPRIYHANINPSDFYPSYLQTYIERDIRTLKAISNLNLFTRFLGLCAGRIGQVLNITSLANDTGISVNTAKSWLSLLEASFIIYLLQPYYRNFNKRLIKAPKLYFYDTGIASSLLKLMNQEMVSSHYSYGALFENIIISEIIKSQSHLGKKPSIYYWRESNGIEIDCIIEKSDSKIFALEIKGGQTFSTDYLKNLKNFTKKETDLEVAKILIYAGEKTSISDNINITNWNEFPSSLEDFFSLD